jgi:hypothetical protein
MELFIYYRISDKGRPKAKLVYADKFTCLANAVKRFGIDRFYVLADNCSKQTIDFIKSLGLFYEETSLGNSASFVYMIDIIIQKNKPDDYVYLLEDDYIHRSNSKTVLLEGLAIADYISLYDHPDKYFLEKKGQGNPFNYNKLQKTRLYVTRSAHWREINSTTMTFACQVRTLREDYAIWKKYCNMAKTPKDFYAFITLTTRSFPQAVAFLPRIKNHRRAALILFTNLLRRRKIRRLISVIPAYATHTDIKWIAPCIDWEYID